MTAAPPTAAPPTAPAGARPSAATASANRAKPPRAVLSTATDELWASLRDALPDLPDDRDAFFDHVAPHDLAQRHVDDLYLAWACLVGSAAALALLERDTLPRVCRALRSFGDPDEIVQMLREQMIARRGLAAYDGRAPPHTWLRVCATRIASRERARGQRAVSLDDAALDQLAPGVPDPELAYFKRHYGDAFRTAFADAVASLEARDRNLLRLAILDGLGIDQLAAIFHVHRATAARQLKQARGDLVAATRDRMCRTLALSPSELDSVLRMIHSLTDVSLKQLLGRQQKAE
jgi:RNA polymerase sigma-70 factor (ECF subfamily)